MCATFIFAKNTIAIGVKVQIFQNDAILFTVTFTRNLTFNIAEGCISNIITGYYDLYVYDVENDNTLSQLPAIIKNQVFVDEQTSTPSSTTVTTVRLITVLSSNSISLILSSSISSTS